MELRLLGPVEVHAHGGAGPGGPPQQRAVLAALGVDTRRSVPLDVLLERVWGHEPPRQARRSLHTHITRIRRLLEWATADLDPPARVVHKAGGYLLDLDPIKVDLHRFRHLLGRATDPSCPDQERLLLLRAALDLWQGQPLAGLPGHWAARSRQGLAQERLDAVVAWAHAELRSGSPTAVIATVADLLNEHPLVESLTATLMHALHATGRTAQALDCYLTTRNRFIEELGVDPSPQLQQLHQEILRGTQAKPAPPPPTQRRTTIPKELPLDVPGFTGRAAELARLDQLLAADRDTPVENEPAPVVITAVSGTAGVGKTALAVRWAHRVADHFPDGQLYINLRGYDPERPMTAGDALARILTALGVPGPDIPLEVDERASRYRTEIAGRRMLILLDNAATSEQVRLLLPGTTACVVLVTSRDSLAGLVALHGAHRLDLDLLPPADALALLRRLIGERVNAEPDAAVTLAEQCARLPLALRVAAELAASRPTTSLADLVTELADQQRRLHLLDAGGDPRAAVAAVFSWSVRHLPQHVARSFALLGLHPGPHFDAHAAAALTGTNLHDARHAVGALARAHLLHPIAPGRYGMHDLLRAYAASQATDNASTEDPRTALERLFDHYLATAAAAMDTLYPAEADQRPRVPPAAALAPPLADPETARGWLDTERPNLAAMATYTATHGWPAHTVRLSTTLFRYLLGGHHTDALDIHNHADHAAQQAGDTPGQARAQYGIGIAHLRLARYPAAASHLHHALRLFRESGQHSGEADALNSLGLIDQRQGSYGTAADYHNRAYTLYRRAGDRYGQARALNNLGIVHTRLGQPDHASEHFKVALNLFREAGDRDGEARVLSCLGIAEQRLGHHEPAASHLQQALALFRDLGNRAGEAHALDSLGTVQIRLGRPDQATKHLLRALTLFRECGDREGEAWTLNSLGEAAHTAGHSTDAIAHHTHALTIATQIGAPDQQARAHTGIGHAHRALGNPDLARAHYTHALTVYTRLGTPDADEVQRHITALNATSSRRRH